MKKRAMKRIPKREYPEAFWNKDVDNSADILYLIFLTYFWIASLRRG